MNFEKNCAGFSISIEFLGGGTLVKKIQGFPGHYYYTEYSGFVYVVILIPEIYSNPEIPGDTEGAQVLMK